MHSSIDTVRIEKFSIVQVRGWDSISSHRGGIRDGDDVRGNGRLCYYVFREPWICLCTQKFRSREEGYAGRTNSPWHEAGPAGDSDG